MVLKSLGLNLQLPDYQQQRLGGGGGVALPEILEVKESELDADGDSLRWACTILTYFFNCSRRRSFSFSNACF